MRRLSNASRRTMLTFPLLASFRRMSQVEAFIPLVNNIDFSRVRQDSFNKIFPIRNDFHTIHFSSDASIASSSYSGDMLDSQILGSKNESPVSYLTTDQFYESPDTSLDFPPPVSIHFLLVSFNAPISMSMSVYMK